MAYALKRFPANRKDIDVLIEKAELPNAILLYGDSDFFIARYGEKIATILCKREEQYRYYFGEYEYESIKNTLSQSSLFGDRNLVIIKTDKVPPKKELSALVELVVRNSDNFLILELYKNPAKTAGEYSKASKAAEASFKEAEDSAISCRFFNPYPNESLAILRARAHELNLKINDYLLEQIIMMQENNIALAYNELDKLQILDRDIESRDINELCFGMSSVSIEELILKIVRKEDVNSYIIKTLEEGAEEIQLLNAITSFFSQLFLYHAYIKTHGSVDAYEITGIRNLPKHIYDRNANLSIKFKESDYLKILAHLQSSSLSIKKNSGEKSAIFLSSLIKLQELIR